MVVQVTLRKNFLESRAGLDDAGGDVAHEQGRLVQAVHRDQADEFGDQAEHQHGPGEHEPATLTLSSSHPLIGRTPILVPQRVTSLTTSRIRTRVVSGR